jgi:hypothetical protein
MPARTNLDAATAQTLRLRLDRYGDELRDSLRAVYDGRADATYDRVVGQLATALASCEPWTRRGCCVRTGSRTPR